MVYQNLKQVKEVADAHREDLLRQAEALRLSRRQRGGLWSRLGYKLAACRRRLGRHNRPQVVSFEPERTVGWSE